MRQRAHHRVRQIFDPLVCLHVVHKPLKKLQSICKSLHNVSEFVVHCVKLAQEKHRKRWGN